MKSMKMEATKSTAVALEAIKACLVRNGELSLWTGWNLIKVWRNHPDGEMVKISVGVFTATGKIFTTEVSGRDIGDPGGEPFAVEVMEIDSLSGDIITRKTFRCLVRNGLLEIV